MPPYAQRTLDVLTRAGWQPGRAFDVAAYERLLRAKGYPLHPAVLSLLREFGGLYVAHSAPEPTDIEDWHFNVAEAIRHTTPENVRLYSRRAGMELCVIGEANREHLLLLMDERGRMYAGYDQIFPCASGTPERTRSKPWARGARSRS